MAEEKKEPWLSYLALSTVILAVCATLSTFKGGGYSTRSVIAQAQASDQWAFFQAKSVKENLYQIEKEKLNLQLSLSKDTEANEQIAKLIDSYGQKTERYEQEKKDIEAKAKDLEAQRDSAQAHGRPFGLAVIFLQVAILLSSIAGLLKRKAVWLVAMPVGLIGLLYFADGFFLFL